MAHIDEDKLTLVYEAMYNHPEIGKTATKVYKNGENGDNDIEVIYHSTSIVTVKNGIVTLNNGGWMSLTTKKRMNQTSRAFDLGFYVYQKNNEWFVTIGDETIPFEEGMSFSIKNDSPLTKNLNPTETAKVNKYLQEESVKYDSTKTVPKRGVTKSEFIALCAERTIMPELALENDKVRAALVTRDREAVIAALDEEF